MRERVSVLRSLGFSDPLAGGERGGSDLPKDIERCRSPMTRSCRTRLFRAGTTVAHSVGQRGGLVFEDLLAADSISVKVRNRVKKRQVKNAVEVLTAGRTSRGTSSSDSKQPAVRISPAQALDELTDRRAPGAPGRSSSQALRRRHSSGRARYEHREQQGRHRQRQ